MHFLMGILLSPDVSLWKHLTRKEVKPCGKWQQEGEFQVLNIFQFTITWNNPLAIVLLIICTEHKMQCANALVCNSSNAVIFVLHSWAIENTFSIFIFYCVVSPKGVLKFYSFQMDFTFCFCPYNNYSCPLPLVSLITVSLWTFQSHSLIWKVSVLFTYWIFSGELPAFFFLSFFPKWRGSAHTNKRPNRGLLTKLPMDWIHC